ncbi:phosphopentomutase [Blautia sp. MSJ-19]|uniref:phosphopentomutase n=1 Tax=Blautia sp. MSJ-19 TaxID=2841517 RepID=UPI001C0F250D|nr:phosphopentomutase [Blautia sp. MSJ-19]
MFLVVLDSFGIGYEPDAADFGDGGSNTLASVIKSEFYHTPNMKKLGFFNIDGVEVGEKEKNVAGAYGRMREKSRGKDTTVGHWEIAGVVSEKPLPTYPDGFPKEVLDKFSAQTGRKILCNKPYSGTEVIKDYGKEQVETGALIVYTSADSVFQIAAHEDVVPLEELYNYCRIARKILVGEHGVGRVIARPFIGEYPNYVRTANRHDFSLTPPKDTMLDVLDKNGFDTISIGKIYDIFAGRGIKKSISTKGNTDGIGRWFEEQKEDFNGICFLNLVDFDMLYGHRNNVDGYAKAATEFDEALGKFMSQMRSEDILIITADHGCDPGFKGTDHTREYTPMLMYGKDVKSGVNLGTRLCFGDIGQTILDIFGIDENVQGESFWNEVKQEK